MDRFLAVFFLLYFSSIGLAQKRDTEIFAFKKYEKSDTILWKNYEAEVSIDFKLKSIDYLSENFFNFIEELPIEKQNGYFNHFHFIDLNNDNKVDVLFEGWSGFDHKSVMLFVNVDQQSFVRIFNVKEIAVSIEFSNHSLKSLTVVEFGNDMEYLFQEVRYEFDKDLKSSIRYVRAYSVETEFPKNLNPKPFMFRVNTPLYTLRLNPVVDNQTKILFFDEVRGNAVGVFREGNLGYAWAETKDQNGDAWWFVEMMPVKKISQSIIYIINSNLRAVGWMKAELLEKVK